MTILHITATDAASITKALNSFILEKQLDYRKLVGQAYNSAAVFSGSKTGVQTRMRTNSVHALYFHCACHRLQLASIQAAEITCRVSYRGGDAVEFSLPSKSFPPPEIFPPPEKNIPPPESVSLLPPTHQN